jgi:hypothetical protein
MKNILVVKGAANTPGFVAKMCHLDGGHCQITDMVGVGEKPESAIGNWVRKYGDDFPTLEVVCRDVQVIDDEALGHRLVEARGEPGCVFSLFITVAENWLKEDALSFVAA